MAKSVHDDVLDGALNIIKNNTNIMTVCSSEPTTRTEAVTTYALGDGSDLLYVTTCTSQSLTSGNTITFPAWDIEIADPS